MQFFSKQTCSTVVELSAEGEIPFQVCHQALYFVTANQRKSSFAVYSNSRALNMF